MTRTAAIALFLLPLAVSLPAPSLAGDVTMPLLLEGTYIVHTADPERAADPVVLRVTDISPLVAAEKISDNRYDCHVWGNAMLDKGGKRAEVLADSVYCYRRGGSARDTVRFKADGTVLYPDGKAGIPARPTRKVGSILVGVLERGTKAIFTGSVTQEVCSPASPRPSSLPPAEIRAAEPAPGK